MSTRKTTHTFKTVGECEIKADVYRRAGDEARPVIVWIHGGALIVGSRSAVSAIKHVPMYLDAGYALVSIDYRLAPETGLPAIIEDLRDALRWVREEGPSLFGADPERIAVVGHSAGGYLTLMSGLCIEPRPKALVSFYGYGDLIGEWYSKPDPFYCRHPLVPEGEARAGVGGPEISETDLQSPERGAFYLYCRQQGSWPREVSGHDPEAEPEFFTPFCPLQNVTPDFPPTLLLHGEADTDVPYEQSVLMARELARAGVEHELITIPGGGHGFDFAQPDSPVVVQAFERVTAFLRRHLA